ncbi:MAG: chromosomal replication initiator protein DnaA [Bacteroidota bacterium]
MNHLNVWDNCLQTIKKSINAQTFKTWFEPIKPIRLDGSSLTIQVPNAFYYEWLEENYVGLLKKTIRQELGEGAMLEYQFLIEDHKEVTPPTHHGTGGRYGNDAIRNPFVIPGIKKMRVDPQLNTKYTFDNFIEGDCNKLARSAGLAIAKNPGGTAFNPLVVYGEVGLGKTHLVHAIGNEIKHRFPQKNVLYISTERFTNQIIESIKKASVNELVNFYQSIDVLLVDDIQFLSNKQKTQEIFFNIFNHLHQIGKQIILTSDRAPKSLEGIQDRLISRFKWGLSADLQTPDFETRMAILLSKMDAEGVTSVDQDILEFIGYNVRDNVRELEGVVVSLIAQSSLNHRTIDLELAKKVVENFVTGISKEVTIDKIKQMVSEYLNVPIEKIQGKTRKREVVMARQLSMYLAKHHTNSSLKTIGDNFGGRDHSTVIYSCKTVEDLLDTDPLVKDALHELEKKVKMSVSGLQG